MSKPHDRGAARDILSKFSILLPLRAVNFRSFLYETPCNKIFSFSLESKVIWPRPLRIVWENTSLRSIRGLMMGPTFVMQHWKLMAAILKHSKGKLNFALGEKPVIPHLLLLAFWSAFWSFFCSPAFASRSAVKGWNGKRQSHHKLKTVCPFLAQVKFIMLNPIWTESQGHCVLKYGFTQTFPTNQDVTLKLRSELIFIKF